MNNGCVFFLIMLLYAIMILSELAAAFGFLIYNGIFWGKIQGVFNFVPKSYGHLKQIWMLSLATWNLGIIVPLIGPAVPAFINIIWTSPSACNDINKPRFIDAAHNDANFNKVWDKYLQNNFDNYSALDNSTNWENSLWFSNWFNERCNRPFVINLTFLIIMFLPLFIYPIIKFITHHSNKEGYERQA